METRNSRTFTTILKRGPEWRNSRLTGQNQQFAFKTIHEPYPFWFAQIKTTSAGKIKKGCIRTKNSTSFRKMQKFEEKKPHQHGIIRQLILLFVQIFMFLHTWFFFCILVYKNNMTVQFQHVILWLSIWIPPMLWYGLRKQYHYSIGVFSTLIDQRPLFHY